MERGFEKARCTSSRQQAAAAADTTMEPNQGIAAKFDLETPPGSAKAADAAADNTHFSSDEGGQYTKEVNDSLATISLDTPSASDGDSAFMEQPADDGLSQPVAAAEVLPAAAASSGSTMPLSSSLSSFRGSEQVSEAVLLASTTSGAVAPAEAPANHSQPLPEPQALKAFFVKVWVKDPEKVTGKLLASHVTCSVRTECTKECGLAAGAVVAASAAASGSSTAEATAAGEISSRDADDDSPSRRAKQQQQQQQQQQPASEDAVVFEVRRRFDDFELLSRLLKAHYKGYFIPRLPPSDWLSGGDSFLRTRKVDLQDYLDKVVNHPVLQGSSELQLFLAAPGDLAACSSWQRMVQRPAPMDALLGNRRAEASSSTSTTTSSTPAAAGSSAGASSSSAGGGGGAGWSVMMRMRQSILHVVQPKVVHELSADEQQLRQAKVWFKELQQHLSGCVSVVRSLVTHMEALCGDYGELGRALSHFARFEESMAARQGQYTTAGSTAVQRGGDLQKLGYGALRQHSLSKQLVVSAGASLVFLPDYFALIPECIGTLQEREDALDAVNTLLQQQREQQEAADKMAASLGPAADADKRMVAVKSSIHALQEKLLAAEQQYQVLRERNQAELVRLNLQRAEDFRRALARFAALQAQAAAAAADIWSGVADQFSS